MKVTMKELKSLISFSTSTILVTAPDLVQACMSYRPDVDHVAVATMVIENKQCKAISELEPIPSPCFTKIEEVRYGLKN